MIIAGFWMFAVFAFFASQDVKSFFHLPFLVIIPDFCFTCLQTFPKVLLLAS